jgi:hypothetical protein
MKVVPRALGPASENLHKGRHPRKEKLAERFSDNRVMYTARKTDYFDEVFRKTREAK